MKIKKEIYLLAVSLALSLVVIEIGLRAFTLFPIHGIRRNNMPHPVLKYTLDPSKMSDVDASGFRNPDDNGPHDIVAIGDSQTYGDNVVREDSWPYKLGLALNKSVYNYGVGGYGIYHFLHLAKEAVKHKPEYIILGLYPTNDIEPFSCFRVAPDYYQEFVRNGIASPDCPGKPKKKKHRFKAWLQENSALYSVMKYLRVKYLKPFLVNYFNSGEYIDVGGIYIHKKEINYLNRVTDFSRKIIKDNYDASVTILSLINNEALGNGIKFGVIIIPYKVNVIEQWAKNNGIRVPEKFSVKSVLTLTDKYIALFNEKDIPFVDAMPFVVKAFQKSVREKEVFYPLGNSHPFAEGYESYSLAAEALISQIDQNDANGAD